MEQKRIEGRGKGFSNRDRVDQDKDSEHSSLSLDDRKEAQPRVLVRRVLGGGNSSSKSNYERTLSSTPNIMSTGSINRGSCDAGNASSVDSVQSRSLGESDEIQGRKSDVTGIRAASNIIDNGGGVPISGVPTIIISDTKLTNREAKYFTKIRPYVADLLLNRSIKDVDFVVWVHMKDSSARRWLCEQWEEDALRVGIYKYNKDQAFLHCNKCDFILRLKDLKHLSKLTEQNSLSKSFELLSHLSPPSSGLFAQLTGCFRDSRRYLKELAQGTGLRT
jgi:hypothetical protein